METNYKDIIRRNVCKLLKDKELTPSDAARLIGEKPTCVIRCYNGTRPFPFPILSKLANAFDMRLIDILTYPDKWIPITAIGEVDVIQISLKDKDLKKIMRFLEAFYSDNNDLLTPNNNHMEGLCKVTNVYRSEYTNKEGQVKPKVEVTLCFYGTMFTSESGTIIRRQVVNAAMFGDAAANCTLVPGVYVVASLTFGVTASVNDPGRMMQSIFIDRYKVVDNWDNM